MIECLMGIKEAKRQNIEGVMNFVAVVGKDIALAWMIMSMKALISWTILGRPFTCLALLCSLYIMLGGSDNPETTPRQKTA